MILHGTSDEVVPFSNGIRLAKAFEESGHAVRLCGVPGGNHNNLDVVLKKHHKIYLNDEVPHTAIYRTVL